MVQFENTSTLDPCETTFIQPIYNRRTNTKVRAKIANIPDRGNRNREGVHRRQILFAQNHKSDTLEGLGTHHRKASKCNSLTGVVTRFWPVREDGDGDHVSSGSSTKVDDDDEEDDKDDDDDDHLSRGTTKADVRRDRTYQD